MNIIEVNNLSISYNGKQNAVNRVSFDVQGGEFISIVGESGSGKTTLLHSILRLLPPNALQKGELLFEGNNVLSMDQQQLRKLRGEKISMIFQDTGRYLNPTKKIGTQFETYLKSHRRLSKNECRKITEEELRQVSLTDTNRILRSYPFELSGGMRQRVGIAMAMALRPSLLLADEPTSALDVTVQKEIIQLLMRIKKNSDMTVIMVTHNIELAKNISGRIGVMHQGNLVEWGTVDKISSAPEHEYTKKLLSSVVGLRDKRLIEKYD